MKFRIDIPAFIRTSIHLKGRHLESEWFAADLMNHIEIEILSEQKIQIDKIRGFKIATNHLNPGYQAAVALRRLKPNKYGAHLRVYQNIPTESGLSDQWANAAGILLALNQLWQFNLSDHQLVQVARSVHEKLAEMLMLFIDPPSFIQAHGVLIRPRYISVESDWLMRRIKEEDLTENPFEKIAFMTFPDLKKMKQKLAAFCDLKCGMSDKGPMLFGFSKTPFDAEELHAEFDAKADFIYVGKACHPSIKLINCV